MKTTISSDLDEINWFYELLQSRIGALTQRFGGRLPTPGDLPPVRSGWRTKGVYFFFEPGEIRSNQFAPRVVRVGSHSGNESTIESRIVGEHFADWGRSVFRRHVGAALIKKGMFDSAIATAERDHWASHWNSRIGAWPIHHHPKNLSPLLHPLHRLVTSSIGGMNVVWVEVIEKEERKELEKQCIRLLSNYLRGSAPIDPPSSGWLGKHSLRDGIRQSGLWNIQHVKKPHAKGFLDHFRRYFEPTAPEAFSCPF